MLIKKIKERRLKRKNNSHLKPNKDVKPNLKFQKSVDEYEKAEEIIKNQPAEPIKKKKRSKLWGWLFFLLNVGIVAGIFIYQFTNGESKSIYELFAEKPYYRYLFLALGIQCFGLIIEALKFSQLLKRSTGKFRPILSFKVASIGRYWDNITPFGSGGQPFQIMYLKKNGCSGDIATGVPLAKYMFFQIAYILIGIIALCIPSNLYTGGNIVKYVALVAVILNVLLFLMVFLVSINKKVGSGLIIGGLKLLHKMRIVKNYEKALEKVVKFINSYQTCIKSFAKSPLQVITGVLYSMITLTCQSLVACCVYKAFNPFGTISWIQIMSMAILCEFAMSIIPIPGGSGFAEISFVAMFSLLFNEGTVFWALLFWRILTYYFFIIVGFIVTLIDTITIKSNRKKLNKELDGIACDNEVMDEPKEESINSNEENVIQTEQTKSFENIPQSESKNQDN